MYAALFAVLDFDCYKALYWSGTGRSARGESWWVWVFEYGAFY